MENAAKALTIAGNVLLAVIILSLVMYFYNTWRQIPLEEEAALLVEQAQVFNKQYEVFDKKLMYGVDVLSCVNKAISNNEKYVTGSWLSGALSPTEFAIEVEVILDEPLEEEVTVYYHKYTTTSYVDPTTNITLYDSNYKEIVDNKEMSISTPDDRGTEGASNISFQDLLTAKTKPKFKLPNNTYISTMYNETGLNDWDDVKVKSQIIKLKTNLGKGFESNIGSYHKYTILKGDYNKDVIATPVEEVFLKQLISTITTFTTSDSQLIYNNDDETLTKWSKIEWVPAVSAFKNKKFRCEGIDNTSGKPNGTSGIHYNERTGAIDKLTFVEYSIPSE